jgi:hypothetical protein
LHETKIWGGLQHLASSAIQARQAAMAALLLDPTLAQAHLALATIEQDSWNWAATAREFAMTFTLNSKLRECVSYVRAVFSSFSGASTKQSTPHAAP